MLSDSCRKEAPVMAPSQGYMWKTGGITYIVMSMVPALCRGEWKLLILHMMKSSGREVTARTSKTMIAISRRRKLLYIRKSSMAINKVNTCCEMKPQAVPFVPVIVSN